jgi:hypothetical protein
MAAWNTSHIYIRANSGTATLVNIHHSVNIASRPWRKLASSDARPLGVLHTAAGAKTALFVPAQNLLYVAVPSAGLAAKERRLD